MWLGGLRYRQAAIRRQRSGEETDMHRFLIALGALAFLAACDETRTSAVVSTASPTITQTATPTPTPTQTPTSTPIAPPTQASQPAIRADYLAELRAEGVSAICNDGTLSYSRHRSGTCSYHEGVREWTGLI